MYRDLKVWQKSYKFALDVYKATKTFPKEETYGMVSQIRRAATSIPVNIAEGKMRQTDKEFLHFLYIARGSMTEVEVWLEFSRDLGYLNDQQFSNLRESCGEVGKLINGLIKAI
jgi:four helix bundle protein